ncbi:HpcH/HpaI aldolase/citrate lyase family protein [Halostagnicola kamekurae]|uniref:Citrate lyase subunit beta / citryl-CoA lyase n=1 Tax=Halostagnicola kamekurae TaxID=619731 RepID=A0A1I6SIH8_9EURY|nr:CoA ester lyase [Halostagnicola kamekurae]SFS76723.1 citrate lyase subunit beta / citryl-CoA lyase [Halostagnicola kamekurae]
MARRSVLFTPGDQADRLRKAPRFGADVIVFDLEDAITPSNKPAARETVATVLGDPDFDPDCEVCVRVNPSSTAVAADLEAIFGDDRDDPAVDSLMLPKVASSEDVRSLVGRLADRDATLPIFSLVESAAGVLAAPEIASVPETTALVFGAEDLAADIGATRTTEGTEVLYARERVVLAAAAADIDAVDTVFTDFEDETGLREEAAFAAQLGYDGKLAIHPAQVAPIAAAFEPTGEEVTWARDVLAAKRDADDDGRGVFEVDGEMIDAPLIARAERILDRADDDIGPN